jgi:homoserine O-acetyltransferase
VLHSTTTKKDNNKKFSGIYLVFLSNISKYKSKSIKDLTLENKPTHITIQNFTTHNGAFMLALNLSFQVFGAPCIQPHYFN